MLVFAAIGVFGAGMLAIAAGIPIKDFGFGNTLILSGVLAWCTSAIMITLWACFRDLKAASHQQPHPQPERRQREVEPPPAALSEPRPIPAHPVGTTGWPETIPERAPPPPSPPAPPPPAPVTEQREPRRNVLFSSTRRPRENPRPVEAPAPIAPPPFAEEARPALPPIAADEPRSPPPPRREPPPTRTIRPSSLGPRESVSAPPLPPPPAAPLPPAAPPPPALDAAAPSAASSVLERPARSDADPAVTVLKSGVVDGMAYWLFSDGSIEAQMPEGMMRFTSIDELRAHLDKRP